MHIESGPASKDRNYWLIFFVLCVVFAGYFFYDWEWGYKAKNRDEAVRYYDKLQQPDIQVGEHPRMADFEQLKAKSPKTREEVVALLGEPAFVKVESGNARVEEYPSVYGRITVRYVLDRVTPNAPPKWDPWIKSEEEIEAQLYWGLIPAALALWALYKLIRAVSLRVVVDDAGMVFRGTRIAFEAMREFRGYSPKGWVWLHYESGGQERRVKLDNYQMSRWEEVVGAIAAAKNWPNPIVANPPAKRSSTTSAGSDGDSVGG